MGLVSVFETGPEEPESEDSKLMKPDVKFKAIYIVFVSGTCPCLFIGESLTSTATITIGFFVGLAKSHVCP